MKCIHTWKKHSNTGWDGHITEYRKCSSCGLMNLYMGNEEASEDCTQETFYEPDEWEHGGEKYLVSLNNGLFIPHGIEGEVGSGVTYTFKYSVSTPLKFDTPEKIAGNHMMKVSPLSALGKSLVTHG